MNFSDYVRQNGIGQGTRPMPDVSGLNFSGATQGPPQIPFGGPAFTPPQMSQPPQMQSGGPAWQLPVNDYRIPANAGTSMYGGGAQSQLPGGWLETLMRLLSSGSVPAYSQQQRRF